MSKLKLKYWTQSSVEFSHINAGSRYISAICNFSNLNLFCQFEKWKVKPCYDFSLSSYSFPRCFLTCIKNYFDMIWITKKKSNLIIKDNVPFFWQIYIHFFLKYCPLCYTPILCSSFLLLWWQWKSRSTMQRQSSIFGHINQREIQNRTNAYFALTCYCIMESKCFWSRICHAIIYRHSSFNAVFWA